jgi:hypothetical protein
MVFRDFAETQVLAGERGYGHDTLLHYGWVPSIAVMKSRTTATSWRRMVLH